MAEFVNTTLLLDHEFDSSRKRHYLNDALTVLHCHHFTSLYTQLAIDAGEQQLLTEVAEDSFIEVLRDYFESNCIQGIADRIAIGTQYYAAVGLGTMEVIFLGTDSGEVVLPTSHLDEGWIKKWGKYDKPVNYLTSGFIAALCAAVWDLPARAFKATEVQSIVMGAQTSKFKIVRN